MSEGRPGRRSELHWEAHLKYRWPHWIDLRLTSRVAGLGCCGPRRYYLSHEQGSFDNWSQRERGLRIDQKVGTGPALYASIGLVVEPPAFTIRLREGRTATSPAAVRSLSRCSFLLACSLYSLYVTCRSRPDIVKGALTCKSPGNGYRSVDGII